MKEELKDQIFDKMRDQLIPQLRQEIWQQSEETMSNSLYVHTRDQLSSINFWTVYVNIKNQLKEECNE